MIYDPMPPLEPAAENVSYLCPRAPNTQVKVEGKYYQAKDGVLSVPSEVSKKLDEMMKTRPDMSALFKKIDMAAAKAVIKEHQDNVRRAAVTGPFSSDNTAKGQARFAQLAASNEALTGKSNPVREEEKKPLGDVKPSPPELPKHMTGQSVKAKP